MGIGDIINLVFVLLIAAGVLWQFRPAGRRRGALPAPRPTSFSQSGDFERPARPAVRRRPPEPEGMLDRASEPTAEERPRAPRPATPAPAHPASVRATQIRRQLADRDAVRAAFVLREVLDHPVGMRDDRVSG